jgi:hypothetical protein
MHRTHDKTRAYADDPSYVVLNRQIEGTAMECSLDDFSPFSTMIESLIWLSFQEGCPFLLILQNLYRRSLTSNLEISSKSIPECDTEYKALELAGQFMEWHC